MINAELSVGSVTVRTTQGRGFTPEEVADMAVEKIISVSANAHPLIAAQAAGFRADIRGVIAHYMREAVRAHNVTLANKFRRAGYAELVKILDT